MCYKMCWSRGKMVLESAQFLTKPTIQLNMFVWKNTFWTTWLNQEFVSVTSSGKDLYKNVMSAARNVMKIKKIYIFLHSNWFVKIVSILDSWLEKNDCVVFFFKTERSDF